MIVDNCRILNLENHYIEEKPQTPALQAKGTGNIKPLPKNNR